MRAAKVRGTRRKEEMDQRNFAGSHEHQMPNATFQDGEGIVMPIDGVAPNRGGEVPRHDTERCWTYRWFDVGRTRDHEIFQSRKRSRAGGTNVLR